MVDSIYITQKMNKHNCKLRKAFVPQVSCRSHIFEVESPIPPKHLVVFSLMAVVSQGRRQIDRQ